MEYKNKIFNADCFEIMDKMIADNFKVDLILTSPPYNTDRSYIYNNSEWSFTNYNSRYDIYTENKTPEEYRKWCVELFNKIDLILNQNGVILWNVSYGNDCSVKDKLGFGVVWLVIADLIEKTNFCVADKIVWKKTSALPNNVSSNKLTRIVEDVFVFCRKNELNDFYCNKKIISHSKNGQAIYENVYNFVEAKNNDGSNEYNKATFSSEFVIKLLNIYAKENAVVYDPFMGTGTTAIGCKKLKLNYVGSELSKNQCEYAEKRLNFDNDISRCVEIKGGLF